MSFFLFNSERSIKTQFLWGKKSKPFISFKCPEALCTVNLYSIHSNACCLCLTQRQACLQQNGSGILCQTQVCRLPVPWPCAASLDSLSLPCWRPMIRWVNSPTSMIFAGTYLIPPSSTRNLRAQRCCHVLFPVFNLGKACVWTKKPQTRVPKESLPC